MADDWQPVGGVAGDDWQSVSKKTWRDIPEMAWNDIKKAASNVAGSVVSGLTLPGDVASGRAQLPSSGAVPGSVEFGDPRSAGTRVADLAGLATPLPASMRAGEAAIPGLAKANVTEAAMLPTTEQIAARAGEQFNQAKNMGVDISTRPVVDMAHKIRQALWAKGIHEEHAPTTYKTIDRLAAAPEGAVVTISDLHNIRQAFGNAAGSPTHPKDTLGGVIGKDAVDELMANIPAKDVLAGPASEASSILKDAIGNSAAAKRAGDFDARLTKAERATDRQIAGSLDSQIRSKAGSLLDSARASRGLNDAELAQLEIVNSGKKFGARNILRQFGRGGAGVIPIGAHIATAIGTGGGSIPASLAIGGPLYAARKIAEALTKREANKLQEMLRARSPMAESMTPTTRGMTGAEDAQRAAIVRALLASQAQQ